MVRGVPLRAALLGAGAAFVLALGPANAQDMKAEVDALKKRVAELEGGTSVTISGYVKGDFYIDSNKDMGKALWAPSIALDDEDDGTEDGAVGAHANQSRIRFGTGTDTDFGALNTVLEGDVWGGVLRLRHAYGQLGPVLAGQAWSLLADENTFASTVDFNGPIGEIFHRRAQLRLSLPMGEGFTGQAAVEPSDESNEVPTFLAAVRYSAAWGAVNLAGAAGRADDGDQNVTATGLHFGAHFNVSGGTQVMGTFNMTRGFNGLIFGGSDGTVMDASGNLEAQETLGGMAGVSHSWTDSIRTGAYLGWVNNNTAGGVTAAEVPGTDKELYTLHVNVFWSPVPAANIGFEVLHGWREIYPKADPTAATEGEATRFQIGVQYSF